jgi:hypothetical protein
MAWVTDRKWQTLWSLIEGVRNTLWGKIEDLESAVETNGRHIQLLIEEAMRVRELQGKLDQLVQQILTMKKSGFGEPAFLNLQGDPQKDALGELTMAAIYELAPPGSANHAQQIRQAWALKNQSMTDEEVAQALREGEDADSLLES